MIFPIGVDKILFENFSDFSFSSRWCISMTIIAGTGVGVGGDGWRNGWKGDCVTVDQCKSSLADAGQIELEG